MGSQSNQVEEMELIERVNSHMYTKQLRKAGKFLKFKSQMFLKAFIIKLGNYSYTKTIYVK